MTGMNRQWPSMRNWVRCRKKVENISSLLIAGSMMLLLPVCDRKENIKSSGDDTQGIIDGNAS